MIPIVLNHKHDVESLIGQVSLDRGELIVKMRDGHELTAKQVFDTFGNVGVDVRQFVVPDPGSEPLMKEFRIVVFSLGAGRVVS
jgi:hypothetical protein